MSVYFVPWFLLPPWTLEECGNCVFPGRKFSEDLFPWPAQLVCSQGMPADLEGWGNEMSWRKDS